MADFLFVTLEGGTVWNFRRFIKKCISEHLFGYFSKIFIYFQTKGKEKIEQLPCERFLQGIGFSHAFLPPFSHEEKSGRFQKPVKIAHKAVVLIFLSKIDFQD